MQMGPPEETLAPALLRCTPIAIRQTCSKKRTGLEMKN